MITLIYFPIYSIDIYLQISCMLMEIIPLENFKREDQLNPKTLTITNSSRWSRRCAILTLTFQNYPKNEKNLWSCTKHYKTGLDTYSSINITYSNFKSCCIHKTLAIVYLNYETSEIYDDMKLQADSQLLKL